LQLQFLFKILEKPLHSVHKRIRALLLRDMPAVLKYSQLRPRNLLCQAKALLRGDNLIIIPGDHEDGHIELVQTFLQIRGAAGFGQLP
jgi:hypothetical protein